MRKRSKLLLAGLCATLLLGTTVSAASANRLSVSERNFKLAWSQLVWEAAGQNVSCGISLGGSFHSNTISKTAGALVGHINAAAMTSPNCTGGTMTVLRETLPWHIQYSSFEGTLPTIRSLTLALVGVRLLINPGFTCLFGTTQAEPAFFTVNLGSRGEATSANASGSTRLQGGFLCSIAGRLAWSGTGTVTTSGGAAITVRLI